MENNMPTKQEDVQEEYENDSMDIGLNIPSQEDFDNALGSFGDFGFDY